MATALRADPNNRAETLAFAAYASYAITAERLASIAGNPETPAKVRAALVRTHEVMGPLVEALARPYLDKPHRRYDVALSFAGEQRPYVAKVARILESQGVRFYYDDNNQVTMWGKDLYEYLADVFENQARYVVMFISKKYAAKVWPTHERKSAQARAVRERREYILPARFDDTRLPGLRHSVHYIDLRKTEPEELAKLILEKIGRGTA